MWTRLAIGGNDPINEKVREAFRYIDDPEQYSVIFPSAIATLRRTGYGALFISIVGSCIILNSG
jgi:hypothetical protein